MKKKTKTDYSIIAELKFQDEPLRRKFKYRGVRVTILKIKREQDYWIIKVRFTAGSLIELMAITEDREFISKELH